MMMRFLMGIFLLSIFIPLLRSEERRERGNLVIEGVPEISQHVVERMLQYRNVRSASLQDWDPNGKGILVRTRFGETRQFHYIEQPGGVRRQLTFFPEPVNVATMCPDPSRRGFLFTKDVGGGEFYQVFYFNMDNGEYTMLTDGQSKHGSVRWSNRGDKFIYYSTKRNGRDFDLYLSDVSNLKQAKQILEVEGYWGVEDWSPDDKRVLVSRYVSITETYFYILDVTTGALTQINPAEEKIGYRDGRWARDGKGIYITSDEGSEFKQLRYYDIDRNKFTNLTAEIPWDVRLMAISDQRDKLAFVTSEDAISQLYLLDTKTNRWKKVPGIPMGLVYGLDFHPDGDRLAFIINTPQTPGDVYALHLGDNALERWTYSEVGGLNTDAFVVPELIHYETFDQVNGKPRMIPAFYYKPKKREPPYPVYLYIHGGPELQMFPYFSSSFQYYSNELGIAVLAPNVRGSSGYGKSYLKLDNGYNRENSVKDIGKLLDWIEEQPELDASRVVVSGGSYGGYMSLASMTHYNDRLRAGIDNIGISNFVTFLEGTKEYRRDLRRVEYGDERDPKMREFLIKISPTTNAHKITKPMLVAQGLNDPRVPVGEAEQIVKEIRKNGGEVWYILAKDEGHGFRKKRNRDYYANAIVLFLEKYLLQ